MTRLSVLLLAVFFSLLAALSPAHAWLTGKFKKIVPENGVLTIPLKSVSDGKAHYFKTRSEKGELVKFFLVKSHEDVIRAAVDACDVCYRSGKGYIQQGNVMVCTNCGMRFAADRINEVRGGCNPAPLARRVQGENLIIPMDQINANAWLCRFKK